MNAYETAKALINGTQRTFTYNEKTFEVEVRNTEVIITCLLFECKATSPRNSEWNMIDFQGTASCLLKHKKDLIFDKEGNII